MIKINSSLFFSLLDFCSKNRVMVLSLIKNDFKKQYLGSYLGVFWAFLQPISIVIVLWVVFEFGFRRLPVYSETSEVSFFIWLLVGILPWFYFANSLSSGYQAITSNSFLLKKVEFKVYLLPIVKTISNLIAHFCLLIILMVLLILNYEVSIFWIQIPYYIFCLSLLSLSLILITSSIYVFVKDISNVVTVFLQAAFWLTPIFWSSYGLSGKYLAFFKINPLFYIVEGYRNSFIHKTWFWEDLFGTFLFFIEIFFLIFIGINIFRKLKPHFGDVL